MKPDKQGLGMVVIVFGVLAVVGGFWLFRALESPVVVPTATAPMQFGDSPDVSSNTVATVPDAADPQAEAQMGAVLAQQNRAADALEHYRKAAELYREQLKGKPDSADLLNNYAWLLAANPNAEIRDGKQAVELAKQACELTEWRQAMVVGTLAAAYAEAGQFENAVKTAKRAQTIALANGDADVASKNEKLMKLYEGKQAYREAF